MARNKIADLRNHLFAAIEGLMDEENPMELDRARAVAEVAQVIVNSAKIECDYLKITGSAQITGFISPEQKVLE
jgi:hypothetical protein